MNYDIVNKYIIASLCFIETVVFCFASNFLGRYLNRLSNRYFTIKNIDNLASGAILSIAFTHLLPDGFNSPEDQIILFNSINVSGLIIIAPIVILTSIDFLAGNHCITENLPSSVNSIASLSESQFVEHINLSSNKSNNADQLSVDLESMTTEDKPSRFAFIVKLLSSRAFYLLITLISHSVLEGMVLGVKTGTTLWAMAFGIIAHKWAECFIIVKIVNRLSTCVRNMLILLFCLGVPAGILLGHLIVLHSKFWEIIFGQLAAGFFIYLSFELLSGHTSSDKKDELISWISYILGIVVMSVIMGLSTYLENIQK